MNLDKVKKLFRSFKKHLSGNDTLIYAIESPKYDELKLDEINFFSGCVFNITDRDIEFITVSYDGNYIGSFPVNIQRDDIAMHVPHIKSAQKCGFSFQLYIDSKIKYYDFFVIYSDGYKEPFFRYEISFIVREYKRLKDMDLLLKKLPMPDANLVYSTQGSYDVVAYRNSIISGIYTMMSYLELAEVNLNLIKNVLDFGCGTGRMLLGWHLFLPQVTMSGCDINNELIEWAKKNIPGIELIQNAIKPPLSFSDRQFDLIYLISVFTHLSLETQKLWIKEFQRLLKLKGYILLTVQGETYLSLADKPEDIKCFGHYGYLEKRSEKEEGLNDFGTYHTYSFIERLFGDNFRICGFFPNGRINNLRILSPIAAFQDVYVLQYMRDAEPV